MFRFALVLFFLMLSGSPVIVAAQTTDGVCPGVVNDALSQLGTNCANMARNSACYGFNNVDTVFNVPVPSDFFTATNERADLLTIDTIRTVALNLADDQWGVSLLNVQANLPDALPGQGVVFVLLGGVEVEGDVEPQDAVIPQTTQQVALTRDAELRSAPDSGEWKASKVIGSVPAAALVPVDAIDPTGGWLRIVFNDQPGWISRAAVADDVSALTVVGPADFTPMQAFFFRVGIGGVSCEDVPSLLAVQGPRDVAVDLSVDRVDVRVTSTIVLQTFPPGDVLGDTLQLTTVSGLAIINPDTPNQLIVPPGYKTFIHFSNNVQSLGIEGDADEKLTTGEWSTPVPLTQAELDQLKLLEDVPGNLLNYGITIPILTGGSSAGGVIPQLYFVDQGALDGARIACQQGLLAGDVCAYLGL